MRGLETIVNCAAVLAGPTAGVLIKGGLPNRFEATAFQAVGLAVLSIGTGGARSGLF